MKKKILVIGFIAILIVMLITLTGCGNKEKKENASNNIEDKTNVSKEPSTSNSDKNHNLKMDTKYVYELDEISSALSAYIVFHNDNTVVRTSISPNGEVGQELYGTYSFENDKLIIQYEEQLYGDKRISFPDSPRRFTVVSENEIIEDRENITYKCEG